MSDLLYSLRVSLAIPFSTSERSSVASAALHAVHLLARKALLATFPRIFRSVETAAPSHGQALASPSMPLTQHVAPLVGYLLTISPAVTMSRCNQSLVLEAAQLRKTTIWYALPTTLASRTSTSFATTPTLMNSMPVCATPCVLQMRIVPAAASFLPVLGATRASKPRV